MAVMTDAFAEPDRGCAELHCRTVASEWLPTQCAPMGNIRLGPCCARHALRRKFWL